jgi:signal peptidase II
MLLFVLALVVLATDAASKIAVTATLPDRAPVRLLSGMVYLTYVRNPGAAFSLGTGYTYLLTAIAAVVVVVIARTARRLYSTGWAVSLGLILGGATGNLADRIFRSPGLLRGAVVDFVSVLAPDGRVFPVFNVADSSLCVGVALAVLLELTGRRFDGRSRRHEEDESSPPAS